MREDYARPIRSVAEAENRQPEHVKARTCVTARGMLQHQPIDEGNGGVADELDRNARRDIESCEEVTDGRGGRRATTERQRLQRSVNGGLLYPSQHEEDTQFAPADLLGEPAPERIDRTGPQTVHECFALALDVPISQSRNQLGQQLGPVGEVIMQQRLAHVRLGSDGGHACPAHTIVCNAPDSRRDDPDSRVTGNGSCITHGAAPRHSPPRLDVPVTRALEHDRHPVVVLRHHCRPPAAAAPLVQQIRQRVLVIARVTREAQHHRLVFFHAREVSSFRHMDTTPAFPTLRVASHPLVQHKLSLLRDRATPTKIFKELVDEIATLIAYEATSELTLEEAPVETPLERTTGKRVSGKKLTLVPILRAGLGMVEGVARLVPSARVGHIGLYRDHATLQPVDYYFKVPGDAAERDFFLLDPMLATGGSAAAAVASLKRAGATRIRFLCLVAAPEGVRRLAEAHPDVIVYCAALDRELNDQGYILPGLGDAGDRLFGTR